MGFFRIVKIPSWFLVIALALLVFINGRVYLEVRAPRTLAVSFLNVGDGSAALVRTPSGQTVLIDGGPDASILRELGRVLPFWERTIEVVVRTSPLARDTAGLLDVLDRYRVEHLLSFSAENETQTASAVALKAASLPGLSSTIVQTGQRLDLGGGAYADVLYAGREGMTLRVAHGTTEFFFSGVRK